MHACLVFNPQASTADRVKDFLMQLTGEVRWEVRVVRTEDEARRLGDDVRQGLYDRILVGGGDGTVSRVVHGLAPDFPPVDLALLPFGTGNDFARSLGVDLDDLDQAFRRAVSEPGEPVDAVKMKGPGGVTWFINVANGGMGGKVAHDVEAADKRRWGPMAYWIASATAVVAPEPYRVRLTLDEDTMEAELFGLAVANGRFIGGGYPIAPGALIDDGWLHVTTVPVLPVLDLVTAGIEFYRGREPSDIRTYRARRVDVASSPDMPFSIDGEPYRTFDATFEIVPGALRVIRGTRENVFG